MKIAWKATKLYFDRVYSKKENKFFFENNSIYFSIFSLKSKSCSPD